MNRSRGARRVRIATGIAIVDRGSAIVGRVRIAPAAGTVEPCRQRRAKCRAHGSDSAADGRSACSRPGSRKRSLKREPKLRLTPTPEGEPEGSEPKEARSKPC